MKKEEIAKKRTEALKMYLHNKSKYDISKIINVSEHTLLKWENQGNWKELYNEVIQKVAEKVQSSVEQEKERSLKLIHGAEAIIAQKIQSGEIEGINIQGLASLTKAKTELLNPKPSNIFNFAGEGNSLNIEINIPENVKKLLNELNRETSTGVSASDGK